MGMFDYIKSSFPLPLPEVQDKQFQTKDTPSQFCDEYEIRADGTLWREEYDIVDKSDHTKEGIGRLIGMMTRVNKRWVEEKFTGEIVFYNQMVDDAYHKGGWVEFSSHFIDGKLQSVALVKHLKQASKYRVIKEPENGVCPICGGKVGIARLEPLFQKLCSERCGYENGFVFLYDEEVEKYKDLVYPF